MTFITPAWPAPVTIKAFTTTRKSWPGRKFDHEKDHDDKILCDLLQLPEEPIWINQTHGSTVLEATPENKLQIADATYTAHKKRVSVVITADCLPILICNQQATEVAAIHAGWRGLASGIIENTLSKLKSPAQDLFVWLGPAIGPNCFEVGVDVYDAFVSQQAESKRAFQPHTEGKWLASLYELAKIRLNKHGVSHIFGGNFCTYTQEDLFFSYRRDKGKTGRMASLIWID